VQSSQCSRSHSAYAALQHKQTATATPQRHGRVPVSACSPAAADTSPPSQGTDHKGALSHCHIAIFQCPRCQCCLQACWGCSMVLLARGLCAVRCCVLPCAGAAGAASPSGVNVWFTRALSASCPGCKHPHNRAGYRGSLVGARCAYCIVTGWVAAILGCPQLLLQVNMLCTHLLQCCCSSTCCVLPHTFRMGW
jgi:hypothetical protein